MKLKRSKNKSAVLFVDQALSFGGSIVVLGSLIESLDKEKFHPIIVGEMDESILNYHMQENGKIYVIPRFFNYARWEKICSATSNIRSRLLLKLILYLSSIVRSISNVPYMLRLASKTIKEKVELIYVNNGMSNLEPVIVAILLNRKAIVHFHGIETPGIVQRLLINKIDKFVVISEFLRAALIENGFPASKMVVIPNPVQKSHALYDGTQDLRKYYCLNKGDLVFAIVGRIVRWKGHVEFLKAAFTVLEKVPEAKALIVGDFSDGEPAYQEEIEGMIAKSGYGDRIIMTGYVRNVSQIYSIINVCVHASIEPEPFGLVIVEAMINGVPVIASNIGAPTEIIDDNINGYLVSPFESTVMANTIIQLLTRVELCEKIGHRGRVHVQTNYNIENYTRSVERVLSNVLQSEK